MRGKAFFALSLAATLGMTFAEVTEQQIRVAQSKRDNESVMAYGGSVGKLDAIFMLEIGDGQVTGYYYYPTRDKNFWYSLRGTNPKDGVLVLQEFTDVDDGQRKHTASCKLTKRVTENRIYWEGTMNNTDGRSFPIKFWRPK